MIIFTSTVATQLALEQNSCEYWLFTEVLAPPQVYLSYHFCNPLSIGHSTAPKI